MRISPAPESCRRGPRRYTALASAATLTVVTAALATGSPPAQAALGRPDVTTPDATSSYSTLTGVSAASPAAAWAAGYDDNGSGQQQPLLLHWNGTDWTKVTTSAPSGAQGAPLEGVSAVSATDAWAAGYVNYSTLPDVPLLLHWNGTAWKTVKSPAPSGAKNTLVKGVSTVSATDAWVVGNYENSSDVTEPLTLHWNGTAWKVVASPAPSGATGTTLDGVSADSATDAWAIGQYSTGSGAQPLLLHWNGTAWSQVASPALSGTDATLNAVSAGSATDAWAAGDDENSSGVIAPLILHWNGTAWSQVSSPLPSGAAGGDLFGVSTESATSAWAAGGYSNSSDVGVPLILHWNGTAWKTVKSPAPSGATGSTLNGVSADSATDAWAAGDDENSSDVTKTLTQRWNGTAWTTVKSPNGT
jgi:hypothetical protein